LTDQSGDGFALATSFDDHSQYKKRHESDVGGWVGGKYLSERYSHGGKLTEGFRKRRF